jgi:hypothetical protein
MSDMAIDMAAQLQADGVGTVGTDIFMNFQPDSPDVCITIYTGGGTSEPGQMFGANTLPVFEDVSVDVMIRGGEHDHPGVVAKANAVRASLGVITNKDVNGTYYMRVQESQAYSYNGVDVQDRIHMAMTFSALKYL